MERYNDTFTPLPKLAKYKRAIEEDSPLPIYYQAALVLQDYLETRMLPSGTLFFSEQEVAEGLDISRPTASRAVKDLISKGYLTRERGQRAVVADLHTIPLLHMGELLNLSEMLEEMNINHETRLLDRALLNEPPDHIRQALRLDDGEKAIILKRLRFVRGRPVIVIWSYLAYPRFASLLDCATEQFEKDIYDVMEALANAVSVRVERDVWASRAPNETASLLEIPAWEPCLRINSITYDNKDHPILLCSSLLSGLSCSLRSSLQRENASLRRIGPC